MNDLKDKKIALFFGGRSYEHEVSINSAKTVFPILKNIFDKVFLIYVNKYGSYYLINCDDNLQINNNFQIDDKITIKNEILFRANKGIYLKNNYLNIDLAFILIHGNEGEDGKLQGLLDIMNIKYTGCNAIGSSLCMYKGFAQKVLDANNIKTIDTIIINKKDRNFDFEKIINTLGTNLFIKSETSGSSIGINAIKDCNIDKFNNALDYSFKYSDRVLIQPYLADIEELEVAILEKSDNQIIAAGPNLVVKKDMKSILSYQIKYGDKDCATIDINAYIDNDVKNKINKLAIKIFKALDLKGYSRIDFFLHKDTIYLNEINTIPGLTSKSHYPILINSKNISLEKAIYEICKGSL